MYFDPDSAQDAKLPERPRDLNALHYKLHDILNSYSATRHHVAKDKIVAEIIEAVTNHDMGINLDRLHLFQPDEGPGE